MVLIFLIDKKVQWQLFNGGYEKRDINKITVYLDEGSLDGMVSAKYDEFPGRMIKIHDEHMEQCFESGDERDKDIGRLKRPGIYFLCGKKSNGVDAVYVGQARNVYKRLNEHIKDFDGGRKSFNWKTAYAYTRDGLEDTKRLFLENHFFQMLKESNRYECLTTKVEKPVLDSCDQKNMLKAIKKIQALLKVVGGDIFGNISSVKKEFVTLYCKDDDNGIDACGYFNNDNHFIVLEGSKISNNIQKTLTGKYLVLRNEICANGIVENGVFKVAYDFGTITPASYVVCGRSVQGKKEWITKEGFSLEDGSSFLVSK